MGATSGRLPGGGSTAGGWLTRGGFLMARTACGTLRFERKPVCVEVRGKLLAEACECRGIQSGRRHARGIIQRYQGSAKIVDGGAFARITYPAALGPGAVYPDHESLVLDGTRSQQQLPRRHARRRPVGDVDQEVVVKVRAAAAEHREAQVVTHLRADAHAAPGDAPCSVTRREMLMLAPHAEQMSFVVVAYLTRGGRP